MEAVGAGSTLQEPASSAETWTQHTTKEGKVFWHSSLTGKSTWDKPDVLKTDLERVMDNTPWKEYTSSDGRPYWYNKTTKKSVWKCPEEVDQLKIELSDCTWEIFTDKTIAISRIKTLFRLKGIGSKTRFDEALAAIKADSRFDYLACLSSGEKKQAFAEYQTQLKKQERERERTQKVEARKVFLDTLTKWPGLNSTAHQGQFEKDYNSAWWIQCLPLVEREELFDDYIDENERIFNEKQRRQREEQRDLITKFFRNNSKISLDTKWIEVVDLILQEKLLENIPPRDALQCWEIFVTSGIQEQQEEQNRQIQRARRKVREDYRRFLEDHIEKGTLHARVNFNEFASEYRDAPEYQNLIGVPLATPREIFEDTLEPILRDYEEQKTILKTVLRSHSDTIRVSRTTTFDEFMTSIEAVAPGCRQQISQINCLLFFESLQRRALRREKEKRANSHDEKQQQPSTSPRNTTSFQVNSNDDKHASRKDDTTIGISRNYEYAIEEGQSQNVTDDYDQEISTDLKLKSDTRSKRTLSNEKKGYFQQRSVSPEDHNKKKRHRSSIPPE